MKLFPLGGKITKKNKTKKKITYLGIVNIFGEIKSVHKQTNKQTICITAEYSAAHNYWHPLQRLVEEKKIFLIRLFDLK